MRSIDSLLHIVVFAALFSSSSIFVDSACRNYPNPRLFDIKAFYHPIQDPNSYLKLKAKMGETIDIPVACPQTKQDGHKYASIYKVSRQEFINCVNKSYIGVLRIVDTLKCEGPKPSQTAKLTVNLVNYSPEPYDLVFEEGKEHYFISASDESGVERLCGGSFILFSITVDARNKRYYDDEDD